MTILQMEALNLILATKRGLYDYIRLYLFISVFEYTY